MLWTRPLGLLLLVAGHVRAEAAADRHLPAVIQSLQGELSNCSLQCFASVAEYQTCDDVYEVITSHAAGCLEAKCTTHEVLAADQLLAETCGATPRNVQGSIRGISWALFVLTTIFLAGRLVNHSSHFGGAPLGLDDWAIVASYAVIIGVTAGVEIMVYFGLGRDIWTLDDTHITIVVILFYVAEFAYIVEVTLTKMSILLLYVRIFPNQNLRRFIYAIMIVIGMIFIAFIVGVFNYCKPFHYTWQRWDNQMPGQCDDIDAQTFIHAGLNIVLDLVIFFMPIAQLIKLDMSSKKKMGIVAIFIVGLFVTICSIVRLKYLVKWAFDPNPTMKYADLAVWSVIELDVSVICACMPGMAGLMRRLKQRGSEYFRYGSDNPRSQTRDVTGQPAQSITKTTTITMERSRGGGRSLTDHSHNDSQWELVERSPEPGFHGRESSVESKGTREVV